MQHAAGSSRAYFRRTMDQMRAMDPLGAGWTALVLLLLCAALAWVQITAPRQWALLLHSFASLRLGKQRVGAELDLSNRNLALLLAVAIMATGLFAHGYSFLHGWTPAGPGTFLGFVLAIAALVTARLLLLRAISGLGRHGRRAGGVRQHRGGAGCGAGAGAASPGHGDGLARPARMARPGLLHRAGAGIGGAGLPMGACRGLGAGPRNPGTLRFPLPLRRRSPAVRTCAATFKPIGLEDQDHPRFAARPTDEKIALPRAGEEVRD
jgi:hypothetical protein